MPVLIIFPLLMKIPAAIAYILMYKYTFSLTQKHTPKKTFYTYKIYNNS